MGTHYPIWLFEMEILWMASAHRSRWGHFYLASMSGSASTHVRVFEKRPDIGAAAAGSSHRHPMQA
jgi:hypothetical protein